LFRAAAGSHHSSAAAAAAAGKKEEGGGAPPAEALGGLEAIWSAMGVTRKRRPRKLTSTENDFGIAIQEARKIGARIVYGDRDYTVTTSRLKTAVAEVRFHPRSSPLNAVRSHGRRLSKTDVITLS
jgi:hypothetical protein